MGDFKSSSSDGQWQHEVQAKFFVSELEWTLCTFLVSTFLRTQLACLASGTKPDDPGVFFFLRPLCTFIVTVVASEAGGNRRARVVDFLIVACFAIFATNPDICFGVRQTGRMCNKIVSAPASDSMLC